MLGDCARRRTLAALLDEEPECLQAVFLRERGESIDRADFVHNSINIELSN